MSRGMGLLCLFIEHYNIRSLLNVYTFAQHHSNIINVISVPFFKKERS